MCHQISKLKVAFNLLEDCHGQLLEPLERPELKNGSQEFYSSWKRERVLFANTRVLCDLRALYAECG